MSGETATSTTYSSILEVISDIKEYIYLGIPLVASFNHYNISHDTTVGTNGVITISKIFMFIVLVLMYLVRQKLKVLILFMIIPNI